MQRKEAFQLFNFLSLALVVATLPFSIWLNGVFLIVFYFSFVLLLIFNWSKIDLSSNRLETILIFISHFLIYAITVAIAHFKDAFVLEKKVTMLLLPIFLGIGVIHYKAAQIKILLWIFTLSTLAATIKPLYVNIDFLVHPDIRIQEYLVMDRPYFALYSFFSVFILLHFLLKKSSFWVRTLCVLVSIYFIYFAYIIFAKMIFVAFAIAILICLFIYFFTKNKRKGIFAVIILILTFFIFCIQNQDTRTLVTKIVKMEPFDLTNGNWIRYLSINTRYVIWKCNVDLLFESKNWIFGCGQNYQYILDACYSTNWIKYGVNTSQGVDPEFLNSHFNSHNEFLQTWIETGIIGLISLMAIIVHSVQLALKRFNYLYLAFIILFFVCCLTESLLVRQKGIELFSLFSSLFVFQMKPEENQFNIE